VLFVLSLLFVALRLVVRLRMKHEPLGLDDCLMFLGLALNAGNLACCIAGGFYGLGKHIWSAERKDCEQALATPANRRPSAHWQHHRSSLCSPKNPCFISKTGQQSLCVS
jgi:hypothetical protein